MTTPSRFDAVTRLRAADDFRMLHPEIDDEAVEALAWCYTYDYK